MDGCRAGCMVLGARNSRVGGPLIDKTFFVTNVLGGPEPIGDPQPIAGT